MAIKTASDYLQDLSANFLAEQDQVTYLGTDGVARALLNATANVSAEISNDLVQSQRKAFIETAEGTDLDTLATRLGETRGSATKSSVPVIINGTAGIVIAANTVIKSNISGVQYQTKTEITLGDTNPNIERPILSNGLGDVVIAESIDMGSITKTHIGELSQFLTPISGVTVTNLVPSTGGVDAETDEQLRSRLLNKIPVLNQGTKAFFEALAQDADDTVFGAVAAFDPLNLGTKVYLIKNSYAPYTTTELNTIKASIYAGQRALSPVTCLNATIKNVDIYFRYSRDVDIAQSTIYSDLATKISNYVMDHFGFAAAIKYNDILALILEVAGINQIIAGTFTLNSEVADIVCGSYEIPRFTSLSISDGVDTLNVSISQVNV